MPMMMEATPTAISETGFLNSTIIPKAKSPPNDNVQIISRMLLKFR